MVPDGNVFSSVGARADELIEQLAGNASCRLERIVSTGQTTPPGEWYDQDDDEWVVMLSGAARLKYEDGSELQLSPGDFVFIPAHRKHRVEWTSPDRETVWLALHLARSSDQ